MGKRRANQPPRPSSPSLLGDEAFANMESLPSDHSSSSEDESHFPGSSSPDSNSDNPSVASNAAIEMQPILEATSGAGGLDAASVVLSVDALSQGHPTEHASPKGVGAAPVAQTSRYPKPPAVVVRRVDPLSSQNRYQIVGDDLANGDDELSLDGSTIILEPTPRSDVAAGNHLAESRLHPQLSHSVSLRQQPRLASLSRRRAAAVSRSQISLLENAPVGLDEVMLIENGGAYSGRGADDIDSQHVLNLPGTPDGGYQELSGDTADAATSSANSTANLTPKRTQAQAQEIPPASPLVIATPQDEASIREKRKRSYIEERAAKLGEDPLSDLEISHAAQHFVGDDAIVIPRLPNIPAQDKISDVLYVIENMRPESFKRHPRIIAFNYYHDNKAFPVVVNVDTGKFLFSSAAEMENSVITDAAINKFCEVGAARYLQQALKKFNHEIEIQLQKFVFQSYVTEYLDGRAAAIGIACCVEFLRNGKEKSVEKRQGIIGENLGSHIKATENVNRAVAENEANALSFQDEMWGDAQISSPFSPGSPLVLVPQSSQMGMMQQPLSSAFSPTSRGPTYRVPPSRVGEVVRLPLSPLRIRTSRIQPTASPAAVASSGADAAALEEVAPELDEAEVLQQHIIEIAQHLSVDDTDSEENRAKAIISLVAERERRDLFRKWATETGAPKVYSHYHFEEVRDLPVSSLEGDDESVFVQVVRGIVDEGLEKKYNSRDLSAYLLEKIVDQIRAADAAADKSDSSEDSLDIPTPTPIQIQQQALASFEIAKLPARDGGLKSLEGEIKALRCNLQTLVDRCEVEANWGGETAKGVAAARYPEIVYANDPTRYFQFCGKKIRFCEDGELEVVGDKKEMRVASEEEIKHMSEQALIGIMLQDALGGENHVLKPNCSLSIKGGAANDPDGAPQVYEFRDDNNVVVATFTRSNGGEFAADIANNTPADAAASVAAPAAVSSSAAAPASLLDRLAELKRKMFCFGDNPSKYEENYFLKIPLPERGPIRIIGNELKRGIASKSRDKIVLTQRNLFLKKDQQYRRMEIADVILDDLGNEKNEIIIGNADISNSTFRNCILRLDFSQVDPRVLNTVKFVNCTFVGCKWPEGFAIKKANLQGGGNGKPVTIGSFTVLGANAMRVERGDHAVLPSKSIAWNEEERRVPSSKFVPACAVRVVDESLRKRGVGQVADY